MSLRANLVQNEILVLGSTNLGKLKELQAQLNPIGIKCRSLGEWTKQEAIEDGDTYARNAFIKATHAVKHSGHPSLADDSGLSIDCLNGQPGIASARWAKEAGGYAAAFKRIAHEIQYSNTDAGSPIKAHFYCHLCLLWPNGQLINVTGTTHGRLCFPPRGQEGFGYDPIFLPDGYKGENLTFAEMQPEKKRSLSHRARALNKLVAALSIQA